MAEEFIIESDKGQEINEPKTDFSGYVPLLSICVLILSILKQFFYYATFQVPIKYFMGLNELPIIISDSLLIVLPFSILVALIGVSIDYIEINFSKKKQEVLGEDVLNKRKSRKEKIRLIKFIIVVISIFVLFFSFISSPILNDREGIIIFIIVSVLYGYTVLNENAKFKLKKYKYQIRFASWFLLITIGIVLDTMYETFSVTEGKYSGTIIKTEKHEYLSTDTAFYIGQTEK